MTESTERPLGDLVREKGDELGRFLRERVAAGEPEDSLMVLIVARRDSVTVGVVTRSEAAAQFASIASQLVARGQTEAAATTRAHARELTRPAATGQMWIARITATGETLVAEVQSPLAPAA